MNNDEMWDNFIPTTTKEPEFVDNHGQILPMELFTPVPTFSGRLAVQCYDMCSTKVWSTQKNLNSANLIQSLKIINRGKT